MSYRRSAAAALVAALAAALATSITPAQAASVVTFVSTKGSDTGACTLAAPCRTIAFAITVTSARGEVRVLDSGGYGAATTINRGLTIAGGGNSITTPIVIDAAGHTVVLRDLVLDGRGVSNTNGIRIINGTVVHIERCVVEHFKQTGITSQAEGAVAVTITDSTMRNNGAGGVSFIGNSTSTLAVDNSLFQNNVADGLLVRSGQAAVINSTASENGGAGFAVDTGAALLLERSTAAQNADAGLHVFAASIGRISNSIFTGNGTGIINAGSLQTRQNNTVKGNSTETSGGAPSVIGGF